MTNSTTMTPSATHAARRLVFPRSGLGRLFSATTCHVRECQFPAIMVSPQVVQQALHPNDLTCPTAQKNTFARKGQFRQLSNLPPLPAKPVIANPNVGPERLQVQLGPLNRGRCPKRGPAATTGSRRGMRCMLVLKSIWTSDRLGDARSTQD